MRRPFLLSLLPSLAYAVTGQGPRGVHPINERYIAVADSSIDSLLIVDGYSGGAVVGHLVLHDRSDDDDTSQWLNPISIASCKECKHIFITSQHDLYAIALDKPLATMAETHDFSAISHSVIRPFWPSQWSTKYKEDGLIRTVSVAADGSSAYVAHASGGIFSFSPLNPVESDRRSKHVIRAGDADIGDEINGLHHTTSLKNLVVTRSKYVHILKLIDENGNNPLEIGEPVAYELALDYHCDELYDGADMTFVDTVIINEYAFVMGKPTKSSQSKHAGVAIYRLTWYDDDQTWHDCVKVAGSGVEDAAWVDGAGSDARFSATPHDLAVLPTPDAHVIIVADVDNRALRYVDVTVPVESHQHDDRVRVSSVAYDEDLYQVLYSKEEPWVSLSLEQVMAQDGKSYYHSGEDSVYSMNFDSAQDECGRVGIGRVCTLPEIRARVARGQYPTVDGDDRSWTVVWSDEPCESCHLEQPGKCSIGGGREDQSKSWGEGYKMIAVYNPRAGLQTQCVRDADPVDTMSMCCGLGGPAVINPQKASTPEAQAEAQKKKASAISAGVLVPLFLIAVIGVGFFVMRKRAKPSWWPKFLRNDSREDTGHAPHREVDLRGRDYI